MAKKFYTDINLKKNELQNAAIENLAAAPSDPVLGQVYFNTTDNEIYVCVDADAPTWESMGGDIESVTAGAGLTGGGTDGAVTLDIGQGTGITVNADEIKLKNADSLTDDTVVKWDDTNGQLVDTVITDDGTNVGINNTSPSVELDVTGDTKFSGDSEFLNGNYITKSLPSFSMGAGGVNDEYLVICKQVVAIPAVEELGEGESQSDYYQDATGVTGRIYFSRGSAGSFNNNGYIDIVAQVSKDSGNVNNFDLSEFKIVGDSLFFTQIEEIDIDGTKYLALKARGSGGGSVNHFFFVGNLSDDGADTNILTRVRASDSTVTVTDPQPSGFPIAPYMRQDEDGNVGIGTGTPSDKLDVHGIIAVDGAALIDKSNNTVTIGDVDGVDAIGFLDINTADASTRIFLNDGGNVGIGTTTPLSWAALHVNGTIHSPSLITTDDKLRVRGAGQSDAVIIDGDGDTYFNGGDVGIGTTSPAYKLDVDGNLRVSNEIIGNSYIRTNGGNVVRSQYDTDNYSELESNGNGGLMSAKSGGTVKLYLSSYQDSYFTGGKVLIGTASSIHGSADLQIVGATGNYARIAMKDSDGTNQLAFIDEIEGSLNFTSQNGTSNGTIKFIGFNGAASSTSMIVAADGNVGIGTTSPSVKFEVAGFARLTGSLQLAGNNRYIYAINDTSLLLGTNNTERMRITNTGNVGIGTTSPGYKLDINGSVNIASAQPLRWGSGDVEIINSGYNLVFKTYDGTDSLDEHMRITSSGDVGIGTTSPSAKLSLEGGDELLELNTTLATGSPYLNFQQAGTRRAYIQLHDSGNNLKLASEYGKISLFTGDSNNEVERLTVTSAGNVGIGTASPTEKLHVSGNIKSNHVYAETYRSSRTDGDVYIQAASSSDFVSIGTEGGNNNLLTVLGSGNVGIGTTSPSGKLEVSGNVKIGSSTTGLNLAQSGDNFLIQGVDVDGNAWNSIHLQADSLDGLYIEKDTNKVGIGTTSPTGKLHIYGDASSAWDRHIYLDFNGTDIGAILTDGDGIKFRNITSGNGFYFRNSSNATGLYINDGNNVAVGGTTMYTVGGTARLSVNGMISWGPSNTELSYFRRVSAGNFQWQTYNGGNSGNIHLQPYGGNVGIGTTSPTEKLHVSGNVRIEGDLTVNGSYTQVDTDVNTTEQWNVTNDGTGPAVTINQTGAQDIMDVQDDGTSVFYIEDGGNVGIGTTNPTTTLDVRGDVMVESENTPTVSVRDTTNNLVGRLRAANSYVYLTADHGDTVNSSRIVFQVDGDSSAYITNGLFAAETSVQFTTYGSGSETGTAAYALAVDSSGNVIETAVQGSPTGGSGTAGKLTKWDTSSTLTDSVITESSGSIGIGATSPFSETALHVSAEDTSPTLDSTTPTDVTAIFSNSDTAYGTMFATDGTGKGYIQQRRTNAATYYDLSLQPYGGKVLIGSTTTAFSDNLYVNGDAYATGGWRVGSAATYVGKVTNGSGALTLESDGNRDIKFGSSTNGTKMYIDTSSGNVGIGTTSPAYKIDVNGDGRITGMTFTASGAARRISTHSAGGVLQLNGGTSASDGAFINIAGDSYSTGDYVDIYAGKTYFSGNVGIGSSTPNNFGFLERVLHISAGSASSTTLQQAGLVIQGSSDADDATDFGYLAFTNYQSTLANDRVAEIRALRGGTVDKGELTFLTADGSTVAERMRLGSSGNLGINTASPSQKLDVNGNALIRNTIYLGDDIQHWGDGGTGMFFGTDTISFKNDGGSTRIHLESGGNVGIGTTNPGASLHVASTTNDYVAKFSHTTATGYAPGSILLEAGQSNSRGQGLFHYNTEADESWFTGVPYNVDSRKWIVANKPDTTFNPDVAQLSYALMTVDSDTGNVGVGTTSPQDLLHLSASSPVLRLTNTSDTGKSSIEFWDNQSGTSQSGEIFYDDSGNVFGLQGNANGIIFKASNTFPGSELMRLTSSGRLGIGTTSPTAKLHVAGTALFEGDVNIGDNLLKKSSYDYLDFDDDSGVFSGDTNVTTIGSISGVAIATNLNDGGGGSFTIATGSTGTKLLSLDTSGNLQLSSYGAGYLKSDASGNITVDTSTIEDTLDSVTDRGSTTTNSVAFGTTTKQTNTDLTVDGTIKAGGKTTYTKGYPSLDTTGNDVAGLVSSFNGASAMFIFTCYGHTGSYQRIVYSCWNTSGTSWNVKKVIDEGDNQFDITVDAVGATRTFTFVSRSGTASYSPNVSIEHVGAAIDTSYL